MSIIEVLSNYEPKINETNTEKIDLNIMIFIIQIFKR